MALDDEALREARDARERLLALQRELEQARAAYHGEIGRLHAGGASLREIADALGLSHQRVHQIIEALGHEPPSESGSEASPSGPVGRRTPGGGGRGLLGGARPSWRAALLVLLTIGGVISSMGLWPTRAFAGPARYSPAQGGAAQGVPLEPTNAGGAVATSHVLARTPYLGVACPVPDSIACDRVGLSVWLTRPAHSVSATIGGRRFRLDDPRWSGPARHGTRRLLAGFLHRAGLTRGPLRVIPDSPDGRWAGGHPVSAMVQLAIRYGDGLHVTIRLRLRLHAGWG